MTSAKLNLFRASLSPVQFKHQYRRWALYATHLLMETKLRGVFDPEEIVSETYQKMMEGARGYDCPDGMSVEDFFEKKLSTTLHRLAKRRYRYQIRHEDLDKVVNSSVRPEAPSDNLATLIHDERGFDQRKPGNEERGTIYARLCQRDALNN